MDKQKVSALFSALNALTFEELMELQDYTVSLAVLGQLRKRCIELVNVEEKPAPKPSLALAEHYLRNITSPEEYFTTDEIYSMANGRTIEAIKSVRARVHSPNFGLLDAKQVVELAIERWFTNHRRPGL